MKNPGGAETHRRLLLILVVLGFAAAVVFLPSQFRSNAGANIKNQNVNFEKTVSHENGLENYDIRQDKNKAENLLKFR